MCINKLGGEFFDFDFFVRRGNFVLKMDDKELYEYISFLCK